MCKRRPGIRCSHHTREVLKQHQTRYTRHTAELANLKAKISLTDRQENRKSYLEESLLVLSDKIRCDLADLNAAESERNWLAQILTNRRLAAKPDDGPGEEQRQLARDLFEGKLQHSERSRQVLLMPPPSPAMFPAARRARRQLASRRSDMACAYTQMALSGDDVDRWKHWRDIHAEHSHQAWYLHARYASIAEHGPDWWASASIGEQRDYLTAAALEADFTTPSAPQTLREVAVEVITQHAIRTARLGVDPRIDTTAWFAWRRNELADQDAATASTDAAEVSQELLRRTLEDAERLADTLLTDPIAADEEGCPRGSRLTQEMSSQDPAGWLTLVGLLTKERILTP